MKKLMILVLVLGLCSSVFAGLSDPRTWEEDMTNDPLTNVPGDWQIRGGGTTHPGYTMGGGLMNFSAGWALIDTADHSFLDTTTVDMDWPQSAANPTSGEAYNGSGWWINIVNDGSTGGLSAVYCFLGRDIMGDQRIHINNGDYSVDTFIPMAEGAVSGSVTMTDTGGGTGGTLSYSFTDTAGTTTGGYALVRQPGSTGDAWFTILDQSGINSIDYVKCTNVPEPITIALLGLGGLFLRKRK